MCELSAGQFRASGTRRQLDGRMRVPGQRGRTNWETGGWGHPGWEEGPVCSPGCRGKQHALPEGSDSRSSQGDWEPARHGPLAPFCSEQRCPRSRGQLCARPGPGPPSAAKRWHGAGWSPAGAGGGAALAVVAAGGGQPAVAFMVALGMEAEVAARTGDLAQGFPFGAEIMGGVARNPQRCTLGRPRPTSLPSPCWGPQRVRDGLGGPLTPSRGKSRPSEEGEGLQPGPEAATRLGTWNQKPARVGRPQLGGTP